MNLMPLATRLQTLGLGVKSKTIFLHMMPPDATQAILLRSPLVGTKIDHNLPGYYKGTFQVIVRAPDESGEVLMKKIMNAITLNPGQVVGTQTFNYCRPQTLPVSFPLSAGALIETQVTFDVCYVER